jgi:hypothetical protein
MTPRNEKIKLITSTYKLPEDVKLRLIVQSIREKRSQTAIILLGLEMYFASLKQNDHSSKDASEV